MKNIFRWLFGIKTINSSGVTAANRMKLMVVHDRTQMPPAMIAEMKSELLQVASKYFDIDPESAECVIKSQGNRRAFISAIVPLLQRGIPQNVNSSGNSTKSKINSKSNRKNLSTAAS
jgi:cell division topological specificity factor